LFIAKTVTEENKLKIQFNLTSLVLLLDQENLKQEMVIVSPVFFQQSATKLKSTSDKQYTVGDYYARLKQTYRNWHANTMLLSEDGVIILVCMDVENL